MRSVDKLGVALSAWLMLAGLAFGQSPGKSGSSKQPSQTVNERLPEWIRLGGAFRFRTEGRTGIGYRRGNKEAAYGLTRLLVHLEIQPSPWLRLFVQGQDSRSPGLKPSGPFFRDPLDFRQAYVHLGASGQTGTSLRVGRQELKYGAQRLIGTLNWGNTSRQFDSAKFTLGNEDLSLDIFAASVVRVDDKNFNGGLEGNNIHGLYGRLNRLWPKAEIEPYLFWKMLPHVLGESQVPGAADIYTLGFRFEKPWASGFDHSMEVARQFGSFGSNEISAWAGYWIFGYTLTDSRLLPRLSFEYSYASGDRDPSDRRKETFDQLFPTAHLYHGIADRVGWQNIQDVRAGLEFKPHRKLKLAFDGFSFWLADSRDHLYGAGGGISVATPPGGAQSSHVGYELDATLVYRPSHNLTFGVGYGYLFPGGYLRQNTDGWGTSFPYAFIDVEL